MEFSTYSVSFALHRLTAALGAARYLVQNKIFHNKFIKVVDESTIIYNCYPISPTHFAVGAPKFMYSLGKALLSGDYFIL